MGLSGVGCFAGCLRTVWLALKHAFGDVLELLVHALREGPVVDVFLCALGERLQSRELVTHELGFERMFALLLCFLNFQFLFSAMRLVVKLFKLVLLSS